MRNPPQQQWLDWPRRNPINPETQGLSLEIVGIAMLALSIICVGLRLYVRIGILHNPGVDDWLVLASLIPSIGMTTSSLLGVRYGWGKHLYDSDPLWFSPSLLVSWISQLLYVITITLVKLSICYSFRRLSDKRPFNFALNCTKILILMWGTAFTGTSIFKCLFVDAISMIIICKS